MSAAPLSPIGLHRVVSPPGVLPQAATRLDADPTPGRDEVLIRVQRLNLDAASYRQLHTAHDGDGTAIRDAVAGIITERGKMHNPVTGSGGMLIGTVEAVGPDSPLGLAVGDRVATLVSLTLTPLRITDGLADWDGLSEQVPCDGHAVLFARSIAARLPDNESDELALAVFDVCGAPALTSRIVRRHRTLTGQSPTVAVLGAAGKSGSLSLAAARDGDAAQTIALVRDDAEAGLIREAKLADHVAVADATNAVATAEAVTAATGSGADITVVCVDVPGCEHGAILSTAQGGTIIFFSMATSFPAAALGAEGLAADVEMIIGNGYTPGHADYALSLLSTVPSIRSMFEARLAAD
ncbi:L-erythro-3,5-diaminohexanoate dehydrogenase [Stackebrandtia endophytica]|uniref:L-erythro-3,5-diaminohexanoate dehydrogenase n=1 Tax=Stackebrandtia endophytica TaxID=1496996 RepID=A0A543B4A1_9ACTN|nr:L-erythro-3,5-diaminohexanoate dehydrogenase [Stackebrandtia endophytica]TQL79623.1 L-erythro-3,5-diaminohexanoate dehydrogenase [Stackebrandtia endophytica]